MFERFTDRARRVIVLAQEEARTLQHNYIGTEHLLLGLIREGDGVAAKALASKGVTLDDTRKQVEEMIGKGNATPNGHIPFTPHARQVLELSLREALQLGHSYIGTEHILLGLIHEGEGVGTQVLIKMDVNLGELRSATIDLIRGNSGDGKGDGKGDLANAGGVQDRRNQTGSAILDQFGRNLTAEAAAGKLDPVIGRSSEIERVMVVLSRRTKNNPVLIGEPGVGKTAVVEGLAQKINAGDVPETLKGKQVYSLDLGSMVAGSRYRGDFEERLKKVLKEIKTRGDIVLFIDEIHTIVGAGSADGALGASDMLKPMLARGELQTIGATTTDEYRKYIEKDAALARRFQTVMVSEPTVEDTISILRGLKEKYEIFHGVHITDSALVAAADLSDRYIADRFLPDKAIDLVDEAASRLRMELDSMPVEIDATTRQLTQLQIEEQALMKETDDASKERLEALRQEIAEVQEKLNVQKAGWLNQKNAIDHVQELKGQLDAAKSEEERATRNGDLGRASELRYSVIPGLQQQIQDSEAALEAQKQQDGEGLNEQVTSDEIAEVVSAWTGVPVSKMMQGELDKLKGLEGELHKRVIGQDEAVSAVAAAVRRSRAGLSDPDKPIGSFFFLGPTGVGKTELAKALAECLFDDERALVRIDMSEYMEKFSVQRLIGAPPGYVGYDEGGQLTEAVRRRPYSVILLDEMEKAHPDVFNVLLQVLDDGRLTDGQGRQVSFKNTIIIMTSNVGSKAIADLSGKDEEEMRHQVDGAMAQTFRPEFLNRIDDIVVFHPLGMAQIEKIVDIQLADVRARLAKERMTLAITPAAKQMLAVGGLDPVFGARPLKRLVQREVVDAIAAAIIDGTVREGDQVTVDVDKDGGFTVVCDNTPAATYEVPDAE